jgi:hypothetical protein
MMLLCEPNRAAHLLASLARQTFTIVWYDEPPILLIQMMLDDLKKLLLTSRALLMLKKKNRIKSGPHQRENKEFLGVIFLLPLRGSSDFSVRCDICISPIAIDN